MDRSAGKNTSHCFVRVGYQPSSEDAKKIEWIEEVDSVLSSIKITGKTSIILAGDTNIDLTSYSTTCGVFEQMLDTYKLSCHVTEPNGNGKVNRSHLSKHQLDKNTPFRCFTMPNREWQ